MCVCVCVCVCVRACVCAGLSVRPPSPQSVCLHPTVRRIVSEVSEKLFHLFFVTLTQKVRRRYGGNFNLKADKQTPSLFCGEEYCLSGSVRRLQEPTSVCVSTQVPLLSEVHIILTAIRLVGRNICVYYLVAYELPCLSIINANTLGARLHTLCIILDRTLE